MGLPRIAILILAHKNQDQLTRLVDHLKTDFSIYLHIDRKSKVQVSSENNVHVISKYKVYWGSYNQILATRELMKTASAGNYDRYLLISGQDMPVVPNSAIIQYFTNNRNNYIQGKKPLTSNGVQVPKYGLWRMMYFHVNRYGEREVLLYRVIYYLEYLLHKLQDCLGLYRKIPDNVYFGHNFFNLTHEAVVTCLRQTEDQRFMDMFKYTKCADEIIMQTILYNSDLLPSMVDDDLRYTDFCAGGAHPKVLTIEDYDKVMHSAKLFARKFDEKVDRAVIDKIYENIS